MVKADRYEGGEEHTRFDGEGKICKKDDVVTLYLSV